MYQLQNGPHSETIYLEAEEHARKKHKHVYVTSQFLSTSVFQHTVH